jgi:hypothetical protein
MTTLDLLGLIVLALVLALLAGSGQRLKIGAAALGKELAALMGAFFGRPRRCPPCCWAWVSSTS